MKFKVFTTLFKYFSLEVRPKITLSNNTLAKEDNYFLCLSNALPDGMRDSFPINKLATKIRPQLEVRPPFWKRKSTPRLYETVFYH